MKSFHYGHTLLEVEHSVQVPAFPKFLYYTAGRRTFPDHPPLSRQLHPCLCKHPSHSTKTQNTAEFCHGAKFTGLMGIFLDPQIKIRTHKHKLF